MFRASANASIRSSALIVTALIVAIGLGGCVASRPAHPLGYIDASGTGSRTIAIHVPDAADGYFQSKFTCSSGSFTLRMGESTAPFDAGNCNAGRSVYQLPLPARGASILHFTIQLDPGSTFELSGHFQKGQ